MNELAMLHAKDKIARLPGQGLDLAAFCGMPPKR